MNGRMPTNARQMTIDPEHTSAVVCKCGHDVFEARIMFRKISKILTGEPKDTYIPVQVFSCEKCKELCDELVPEEFKKNKIKV